jgi:bacterioferritin (cytochrome b1)
MPSTDTIEILNRVLVLVTRSFPQYLRYAKPYTPAGREDVLETIHEIAAEQERLAERIGRYISDSGGLPDAGRFPIELTDTHDLAIDFLILEAIGYQKEDIANLQQCVDALRFAPAAQSLAAEALGMTKGNLQSLEELHVRGNSSTKLGGANAFANDAPVSADMTGAPRQEERKLAAGSPDSPG